MAVFAKKRAYLNIAEKEHFKYKNYWRDSMAIKPLTLSLTTFLKICSKKPRGKVGEIRRFTLPGGYDFYKKMKRLAEQLARKEIDLDQAKVVIASITKSSERDHTLAAIEKLHDLLKTWKLEWHEPPSGSYVSPSGLLVVKLEPELGFSQADGSTQCLTLWNLARPELDGFLAGEGLWLLRDEIGEPDNMFGILDLRKKAIATEKLVTRASEARAKFDLMIVEEIWKDIHNPGLSYDDTVSHISSISGPPPAP